MTVSKPALPHHRRAIAPAWIPRPAFLSWAKIQRYCLALGLFLFSTSTLAETSRSVTEELPVGAIILGQGTVDLQRPNEGTAVAQNLDLVYPGDRLVTGLDGYLVVRLTDDTLLELTAGSAVVFVDYARHSPAQSFLRLTVERGAIRGLTQEAGADYAIHTPYASVHSLAANTSFAISLAEASVHVGRHAGALSIQASHGQISLDPTNGLGYVHVRPEGVPQTSPEPPDTAPLLGPVPRQIQDLRAARWAWAFPGEERSAPSGTVLWAAPLVGHPHSPEPKVFTAEPRVLMPLPEFVEPEPAPEPPARVEPPPAVPVLPELDPAPLVELAQLIRQRQDTAAVALARDLQRDYEGEPDYDVLLGRALMNIGEFQEATFALERALIVVPEDINTRLTLAEAYLGLGNTGAVRRQLSLVESRSLDLTQEQRVQALALEVTQLELARQRRMTFTLGGELQFYSNINSGLGVDRVSDIDWLGTDLEVADEAKAEPAPAVLLQAGAEQIVPLNQRLNRVTQAGLTARLSTFGDANNLGGMAGVTWVQQQGRSLGVQLLPSWTTASTQLTTAINGQQANLYETLDLGLSAAWTWSEAHSVLVGASVSDSQHVEIGASPLVLPWQAGVSLNLSSEDGGAFVGLGGGLQPSWTPSGRFQYQGLLGYQLQWFPEEPAAGSTYTSRRLNQDFRVQVMGLYPWHDTGVVTARVTAQKRFSNQALHAYGGVEFAVGYQQSW